MTPVVVARDLVKRYRELVAVRGVSFEVRHGECYGLLGPNGAGKTTIIRMMHAFTPITSGRVEVFGLDVATNPRKVKALCGVCPQEDNLDPDFTATHNLVVYARYFGIGRTEALRRADSLLAFVGLTDKAAGKIRELSGGMKRRLVIARSLVNGPRLLILDEPTTGLDPQARQQIWDRVRALKREGTTIVLTTHYMEEAATLCDRVAVVDEGRIVAEGEPEALVRERIGRDVLEIWDPTPEMTGWAEERGRKHERSGARLFVYSPDGEADFRDFTARFRPERRLLRRASLEDVFLQITGREFRD